MTISELAKIALDEGRVVKARRGAWEGFTPYYLELDPFFSDDVRGLLCSDLAADDWYEVKDQ